MIGLAGAHRTGKTTLAKRYAEEQGIPVVITTTAGVFAKHGLSPKEDYDFETRLMLQWDILESLKSAYSEIKGGVFITDRTPIDLMAYTLADVQRQTLNPSQEKELQKYLNACIDVANRHFSMILVIQPGIELVEDATKATLSSGYIEHLNSLVMGITVSESIRAQHFYIPRLTSDIDDRVNCVRYAMKKVVMNMNLEAQSETTH